MCANTRENVGQKRVNELARAMENIQEHGPADHSGIYCRKFPSQLDGKSLVLWIETKWGCYEMVGTSFINISQERMDTIKKAEYAFELVTSRY